MAMPSGRYYIGDLCYVMHPEWAEFCALTIKGHDCMDGEFALADGRRFATYRTAYGDGCYPCSTGAELGVDAGLIGCIRVEDIRDNVTEDDMLRLGTIVNFVSPFSTGGGNGLIYFGSITVDTNGQEYDDDEDEDYDDDES